MNQQHHASSERFARLTQLLQADPENPLLLAEASDAALAAGAFDVADQWIGRGSALEGNAPAWLFRRSNLLLARRQLDQARGVLEQLKAALPDDPAVDHNLAYILLLQGRYEECAHQVQRWTRSAGQANVVGAAQALWLRAQHHRGQLDEAWAWIRQQGAAIAPVAAGVASLIAIDADELQAAKELADLALRVDPAQPEALIAGASAALADRNPSVARPFAQRATELHPHLARAWSTLGYADLLSARGDAAARNFERALQLSPQDVTSLMGKGWACLLQNRLQAAEATFRAALQIDPDYADAHGALAIAAALAGSPDDARRHAGRAGNLQSDGVVARYAEIFAAGGPRDGQRLQALTQELLAASVRAKKPRGRGQ